jgi:hypothetical protein
VGSDLALPCPLGTARSPVCIVVHLRLRVAALWGTSRSSRRSICGRDLDAGTLPTPISCASSAHGTAVTMVLFYTSTVLGQPVTMSVLPSTRCRNSDRGQLRRQGQDRKCAQCALVSCRVLIVIDEDLIRYAWEEDVRARSFARARLTRRATRSGFMCEKRAPVGSTDAGQVDKVLCRSQRIDRD